LSSQKITASGEMIEGMYHLSIDDVVVLLSTQATSLSNFISLPQQALWHFRLGNMFIFITLDHYGVCDVFQISKFTIQCSSKTLYPYELLHFDIFCTSFVLLFMATSIFLLLLMISVSLLGPLSLNLKVEPANKNNLIKFLENQHQTQIKTVRITYNFSTLCTMKKYAYSHRSKNELELYQAASLQPHS